MTTDYTIVFDGGSRGNPGPGYGSYALVHNATGKQRITRLDFTGRVTSNEAEYDTLIAALEDLIAMIERAGRMPGEFTVEIRGDSRLVIEQVCGRWQTRDERMRQRCQRARALVGRFKRVSLVRQPRERSVDLLGH